MARLSLALLGAPEVRLGDRMVRLPTRKAMALLAYLATEGGSHTRERLVDLLWPDAVAEHGRTTLRSTLRFLRVALDQGASDGDRRHLVGDRDTLGFELGDDDELDLRRLRDAARLARASYRSTPIDLTPQLQAAASLYRGDYLEGFTLDDTGDFDDWVAAQREAWHRRIALVLDRLSVWQSERGEVEESLESAQRWVALDPLSEAAYRRIIELHLVVGDRAVALRAYDRCCAILHEQLGAEPNPETEELARRARRRVRRAAPETIGAERPREVPLVGRGEEYAQVVAMFRAARARRPSVVVVQGEAGIGKTRLVTDFLGWAAGQGADVLAGQAFETAGRLSYQPIIDALRRRLEPEPELAHELLPAFWVRYLARLLPELAGAAGLPPDDPAEVGAHLCEAVVRLLRALAGAGPVALFIDDLHWADEASLDLLRYLSRSLTAAPAPLLLLLSVRSEELGDRPQLGRYLVELERDAAIHRLTLGPLPRAATFRLLRSLDELPVEEFGDRVFEESGGHPLFLLETLRHWRDHGIPAPGSRMLAPGIRAAIQQRMATLGAEAAAMAAAASVLGGCSAFELLQNVAALGDADCLRALDQLLHRRVLQAVDTGYTFTHDNIRQVAYEEAGAPRRQLYHRRALSALQAIGAPAAELVTHALSLGQTDLAYDLSLRAGDDALALSAGGDAIRHYERAAELGIRSGDEVGFFLSLGDAYRLCDRMPAAEEAFRQMLRAARTARRPRDECLALNRLAIVRSQQYSDVGEDPGHLLKEALAVAEAHGQRDLAAESLVTLSLILAYRMDLAGALRQGARAAAMANELGLEALEAGAVTAVAQAALFSGRWGEGQTMGERATALYDGLGDRARAANARCLTAGCLVRMGRLDLAIAVSRRSLAISREIDNAWGTATACFHHGESLLQRGRCGEALAVAEEGVAAARRSGFAPLLACNLYLLGSIHRAVLDLNAASAAYEEARAMGRGLPARIFEEMARSGLCATRLLAGDWEEAAACAHQALRCRSQASPFVAYDRWADAEALARSGQLALAAEDLALLHEQAGRSPRVQLTIARGRAAIEAARGDRDAAAAYLHAAADLAAELELPIERWQICLAQAEAAPDNATTALDSARHVLASLDSLADLPGRFAGLTRVRALRG